MQRETPLATFETYHIFNRGAHKQRIFTNEEDYARFLLLLHITNTFERTNLRELFKKYKGQSFVNIFELEKPDKSLVDVLGYCLMPNHFHLIIRQKVDKGISIFLKKVLTAYSMYFNAKYAHSGVLSQGPFKSRHVDTENYHRYIFSYVHLNPLSLLEPDWETTQLMDKEAARRFLSEYIYSSYYDYSCVKRPERSILAYEEKPDFLNTQNDLEELLYWYSQGKEITKDSPL